MDHQDRLFRAAYALCGSSQGADDLVQDTLERVRRRPGFLRREDDPGYLLRMLRNTAINAYQTHQQRPKTMPSDESVAFVIDPGADPSVSVTDVAMTYAVVHDLAPALRDTLIAVDVVGLSYRKAAHALRVPRGTIMSRLYRARKTVAERLEQAGEPPPRADR